ncbi:MAG: chemotaxis protein CheB, partial [Salinibacter sp.]|uniref:chemotaxis protein CheB n=1 Tax=Salinibacter sp. TaxID=2065818 RepID=UPI002FC3CF24
FKAEADGHRTPVVGIGASAGGVEALSRFFDHLPEEVGMAFAVVLHLSPDHESSLAEILQHHTDLPVETATDGCAMEPDHVYVIPSRREMQIEGETLRLSERSADRRPDTVDALLSSLAEEYGHQAIGIVLSGTGADGTLGLRSIKAHGGIAMVQEPSDAEHGEMPRNALNAGVIDLVRPVHELAERLVAYHRNAGTIQLPESKEALPPDEQTTLEEIFAEVEARTGHDFSHYKRSTVLRRVERRLQVTDAGTLEAYLERLRDRPEEARALSKELLISVTRFFRTPGAFETLADTVIPSLFEDKAPDDEVRVWVAGCATGEEAYSVAILLKEHARTLDAPPEIQVFATDIDTEGLAVARAGTYPVTIETDVSGERLDRFFRQKDDQYVVTSSLRNAVVFAEHNLIEDPPFSNLDLVCCRNLLIYLDQTMQEHVFRLFHYALTEKGFLFLGPSEAIGPAQSLFSVVDETRSILEAVAPPADEDRPMPLFPPSETMAESTSEPDAPSGIGTQDTAGVHERLLMKQVASLVVDENYEIIHLTERAGQFLRPEAGTPTHNLLEKVPPALRLELRGALYQAFQKQETTERTLSIPHLDGASGPVNVQVAPVDDPEADRTLVQVRFEEVSAPSSADVEAVADEGPSTGEPTKREDTLEEELQDTKEQLQSTTEKYETATEEMETANEELMSMNEELQAKNEELQTSKEQLRSVNEELTTTNQQLEAKVEALDQANSDLQNLMEATEVATLFLDRDLEIRRYTPPITEIFRLRDSDVGRPITDFTPKIAYDALAEDAKRVLDDGDSIEREVQGENRAWFLMRLRPYRTVAGDAKGVVVTFVDVTAQKRAAEKLRRERDLISALLDTAGALIVVLDATGAIVRVNATFEDLMGPVSEEVQGKDFTETLVAPESREAVQTYLRALGDGATDRANLEMRWMAPGDEQRLISGCLTALRDEGGSVRHFLVTGTDVTMRRELEREIVEISDRERRRIGEDLHDVVGSDLTGAKMLTENLSRRMENGDAVGKEDLARIADKIQAAAEQTRSLSHALVPKALQQDHLAAALSDLAAEEEDFSGISCSFVGEEDEPRPEDDTVAMNLYRIAHEAVANAREHADPDQITIDWRQDDSELVLSVRDDGVGWEGEVPDEEGLGLHLMRYRANLIGASLEIATRSGETVVECRLPLS